MEEERKQNLRRYYREWYYRNKEKRYIINKRWKDSIAEKVNALKIERGCADCGFNSHPEALDFDHLRDKKFSISSAFIGGLSLKKILVEIEKCEVVCANCHRIRTASRRASIA